MATGIAKLQLLLSINNKLKAGLDSAKTQIYKATGGMQTKLNSFKNSNVQMFDAIKSSVPGASQALDMLSNPYVLGAAAAAMFGAAVIKAGSNAIEFNSTFLNIKQLNLDKSNEQLDKYKNQVLDTSYKTGIGANQMSTAFYDIQSATGLFGSDVAAVAEQVGNFSIATGADLNASINSTTKAMKAFGLQVSDVKGLLESNAKTVQVGIVTFDELARVQTTYAGAAAAIGQSVDTANKIFASFTSIAKNAEEAATMTKTAFQGFSDPKVLGSLEKYGVNIYDSTGKMRDLESIIKDTSGKIDTMTDKDFSKFMGDVGGPEGLRMLFGKLRTGADDFFKVMEAYDSSTFDLDQALENAKGDIGELRKIMKNQFETIMTKIGLKLIPHIARGMEVVKNILDLVWKSLDKTQNSTKQWGNEISPIISIFKTIYKISMFYTNILKDIAIGIYNIVSNSEILKDVAFGIGIVFEAIGWAIDGIGEMLEWIWNHTLGPIVDRIETAYKSIKGLLGFESKGEAINYGDPRKIADKSIDQFADKFGLNAKEIKTTKGLIIQEGEKRLTKSGLGKKANEEEIETTDPNSTGKDGKSISSSSQTKNVTINIDSFIKEFKPTNQSFNNLSREELDKWMTEMFLRVIRSAELTM